MNDIQDYFISIFYSTDDGGYIADIPDLRCCSAFGATPEEALREVQVAKALWLETAHSSGKPIPKPKYRPAIYQLGAPPQFAAA
jgi:predicted RNase H-like HicB family nuclease